MTIRRQTAIKYAERLIDYCQSVRERTRCHEDGCKKCKHEDTYQCAISQHHSGCETLQDIIDPNM